MFNDDVDEASIQDLALNEDNVFQADQCAAFDSDVDEAPIAQTMFMTNLSSADPIYDEDGPSYDYAKDIWDNVKMLLEWSELTKDDRESHLYDDFEHFRQHKEKSINDYYVRFSKLINDMRNIKMTMPKLQLNSKFVNNTLPEWGRFVMAVKLNRGLRESDYDQLFAYLKRHEAYAKENKMDAIDAGTRKWSSFGCRTTAFLAGGPDNAFDDDVDEQPGQDLALNVDNVFQAEDCDAFDSDVDEAPTAQTMFMANLSSADPITDEAGPSYDSDILSEVRDHDQYLDDTCAYQEEHVMHDSVQLDHVVDLHADHTSISNMIPYDQYVKDIDVSVVHSNASSVPNDTFMMIYMTCVNLSPHLLVKQDQSLQTVHMLCRPRPLYNDLNKVAIGYKNPLCLTRAKQAQPALYNGHEILKDNHARAKVHNTEDTLEIAEITRKKINAKMTDPECVTHKVKIAPHDYSKENLLATFTPQKQLTPEQIYWSNDLMKLKSKAITDGERGFEQTKACYLQEVIPFFQTIKDNFEGIQKALTREVKQMKDVFEELEAEVAQCAVDRKHDAIDRKNLLIANDNIIAECLSKEVFSVATKSELNVARFSEMHVANTSVEARCLAFEGELTTLRDKNKDTPGFDSVFVIGKMQASLQGKDNAIRQLKKQLSELQATCSDTECTVKVRTTNSQLTKVTDPVTNLQAPNDRFRAENDKVKQHYKQLYDSIKITRAKHIKTV
nr:hypothetical protein [Tanacetum cinerariifolium]